jgi:hypothetical protein
VGKPHKTKAKAFHFRGRFAGAQFHKVIAGPFHKFHILQLEQSSAIVKWQDMSDSD